MGLLTDRKPDSNPFAFPWVEESPLPTRVLIIK
jgi:hypothetical protein